MATNRAKTEEPSVSQQIDPDEVLASLKVSKKELDDLEGIRIEFQASLYELYLNQAAICLSEQREFMQGGRLSQNKEAFTVLKILADQVSSALSVKNFVDLNSALSTIESAGYKVSLMSEEDKLTLESRDPETSDFIGSSGDLVQE